MVFDGPKVISSDSMEFDNPKVFDDLQVFEDPKEFQIRVRNLIIQKSKVMPPSSMVLLLTLTAALTNTKSMLLNCIMNFNVVFSAIFEFQKLFFQINIF